MDGLLRCSRYSFGPNRLHYCGPDANREILSYIDNGFSDFGLRKLLNQFQTLYPYLCLIAEANRIGDPFDVRVVEAYWLGNELLERVEKKNFYIYLKEKLKIPQKIGGKSFGYMEKKLSQGALPHHSFHVLNIWKRTGHLDREHTAETLDSCRISWGAIQEIDGPFLKINSEPLVYKNGKLFLDEPEIQRAMRSFEANVSTEQLKIGDLVSVHWGVVCEPITAAQAAMLRKYTLRSIEFANQTI